jgi:hypothetical protein
MFGINTFIPTEMLQNVLEDLEKNKDTNKNKISKKYRTGYEAALQDVVTALHDKMNVPQKRVKRHTEFDDFMEKNFEQEKTAD